MNETIFRIDYVDDYLRVILTETVTSADEWAACEHGWANMPEGATDFQVTSVSKA